MAIKTAGPIVMPGPEAAGLDPVASTAVTFKSRGPPAYAGQTPLTVRIQRACSQRLAPARRCGSS